MGQQTNKKCLGRYLIVSMIVCHLTNTVTSVHGAVRITPYVNRCFSLRAFYLDQSNVPPSSAPKAALIDKVRRTSHDHTLHGKMEKLCNRIRSYYCHVGVLARYIQNWKYTGAHEISVSHDLHNSFLLLSLTSLPPCLLSWCVRSML